MQTDPTCTFCKIIKGELPSYRVYEDPKYLAFLDINPVSLGHVLVIPKNHAKDMLHSTPHDRDGLIEVVAKIAPQIMKAVGAMGFNIGINTGKDAGQIIFHTHLHIIPRRSNDGLSEWKNIDVTKGELSNLAEKIRRTP